LLSKVEVHMLTVCSPSEDYRTLAQVPTSNKLLQS